MLLHFNILSVPVLLPTVSEEWGVLEVGSIPVMIIIA